METKVLILPIVVLALLASFSLASASLIIVEENLTVDDSAPVVTITSPTISGDTWIEEASVLVTGTVGKDSWESYSDLTVTIQGSGQPITSVVLDQNGSFAVSVALLWGVNEIHVTATDPAGNTGSKSFTFARTTMPSELPPPPQLPTEINISDKIGQTISVGENGVASVSVQNSQSVVVNFEEAQPVVAISVTTSAAMETVSVQAQQISQKPAPVPEPTASVPGVVVSHYLEITVSATPSPPQAAISVQVESAVIEFKVPKSWLTTNNIASDSVRLLKYDNGQWIELPTSATGAENATYKYYSATTTGFSTFAVIGQSVKQTAQLNFALIIGIITAIIIVLVLTSIYLKFIRPA